MDAADAAVWCNVPLFTAHIASPAVDQLSKCKVADQLCRRFGIVVVGKPGKLVANVPVFVVIDGIFDIAAAAAAAVDDDDDDDADDADDADDTDGLCCSDVVSVSVKLPAVESDDRVQAVVSQHKAKVCSLLVGHNKRINFFVITSTILDRFR